MIAVSSTEASSSSSVQIYLKSYYPASPVVLGFTVMTSDAESNDSQLDWLAVASVVPSDSYNTQVGVNVVPLTSTGD